jgi:hypothetical protein
MEGYTGLSKTVVSCVKGIPLVLEVLGGNLYNKRSVEYWERKSVVRSKREKLSRLQEVEI